MPHYFFDVHNCIGFLPDQEGRELPDLETARSEGLKGARSILAEDVMQGRLDLDGRLEIFGADRKLLVTIPFSEAVEVQRGLAVDAQS